MRSMKFLMRRSSWRADGRFGQKALAPYEGKGFTGFLVNVHETSTGVLYDMELISDFCRLKPADSGG
ncbi:MAG: hypothetical protein ACLR8P_19695 [Clostridium fessum]